MKKKIIYLLLSLFIATNSMADVDLKFYKSLTATQKEELTDYIAGVGKGIFWAQIIVNQKYGTKLYCVPSNLALNGDNYIQILNDEISKYNYGDDAPIELILVFGLQHTFPCDIKKK